MAKRLSYDEVWMANYKRNRRTLTGARMTIDPVTGFMRPVGRDGFTAEDRAVFVQRFRVCDNISQICKSLNIDVMTFYDALVVDEKFRNEINAALQISGRPKQLNNSLKSIKLADKTSTIADLAKSAEKYLK